MLWDSGAGLKSVKEEGEEDVRKYNHRFRFVSKKFHRCEPALRPLHGRCGPLSSRMNPAMYQVVVTSVFPINGNL